MVPGVEDMWVPPDGSPPRRLLSPAQLRQQLADIKGQRALVVLLIDLTDASGSFLGRVRDLVGQNPIILVGTKVGCLRHVTDM
jgi:nitric-oxide synthase